MSPDPQPLADLIGDSNAGPVTEAAFGFARGLTYLATALVLGGLAFLLAVWLPALRSAAGAGEEWVQASTGFLAMARRLLLTSIVYLPLIIIALVLDRA